MGEIERNADKILNFLSQQERGEGREPSFTGAELQDSTDLSANEINDAVTILVESGLLEWLQTLGTAPFNFHQVSITPRGRYELERAEASSPAQESETRTVRTPVPVGSPFGFSDIDWETVEDRKSRIDRLYVVLGHQFESGYFDLELLRANIEVMFDDAVDSYNNMPGNYPLELDFRSLAAGYGEHLFNEIARDIISADIAVFETSDLNPNVMLEMGVALTWGVRVLPIKERERPKPPSDISGQTWADYDENASRFVDPNHDIKLVRMVERAARKKGAS